MFRLSADEIVLLHVTTNAGPQYALWADGTHCELKDVDDYLSFMSDDYETVDYTTLNHRLSID